MFEQILKFLENNNQRWIRTRPEHPEIMQVTVRNIGQPGDYSNSFWTCHSSGNLVDGLPLAIHKDAVLANCQFSRRAPIRIFWSKMLDDAHIYREIVRGYLEIQSFLHSVDSNLTSERSKRLDRRRILSVSSFRKCWIFFVENQKSRNCWRFYLLIDIEQLENTRAAPDTQQVNIGQYISLLDGSLERKLGWRFTARYT